MLPNGNNVLVLRTPTAPNNATLDLFDNDLIVDYTGASQLVTILTKINTARNGGAWNGTGGINSTSARSNSQHNTTLGRLEGSEFDALYGVNALFSGRS